MTKFPSLLLLPVAAPALAHPGHVAEQAGHTHWIALAATLIAACIVVAGILRGMAARRRRIANG